MVEVVSRRARTKRTVHQSPRLALTFLIWRSASGLSTDRRRSNMHFGVLGAMVPPVTLCFHVSYLDSSASRCLGSCSFEARTRRQSNIHLWPCREPECWKASPPVMVNTKLRGTEVWRKTVGEEGIAVGEILPFNLFFTLVLLSPGVLHTPSHTSDCSTKLERLRTLFHSKRPITQAQLEAQHGTTCLSRFPRTCCPLCDLSICPSSDEPHDNKGMSGSASALQGSANWHL